MGQLQKDTGVKVQIIEVCEAVEFFFRYFYSYYFPSKNNSNDKTK